MMNKIEYDISAEFEGLRLDQALCRLVAKMSRSRAAQLIIEKKIKLNNGFKKPGYKVQLNDKIHFNTLDVVLSKAEVRPQQMDLDLRFEDDHLLIINKPAGMVVHPAVGNMENTLVNGLLHHAPDIENVGDDLLRPGIVHRLDQDTSGLIVVAKTAAALSFLQKEFKFRRVKKQYLAIASGVFENISGSIKLPIGRHPKKRKIMAVNHKTGKPARTSWKVIEAYPEAALLQIRLETGRTHQIRVHFYAIDHALIGDPVYQPRRYRKNNKSFKRQMLHSWKISFRHPYSGKRLEFQAEPPDDFKTVQEDFRNQSI